MRIVILGLAFAACTPPSIWQLLVEHGDSSSTSSSGSGTSLSSGTDPSGVMTTTEDGSTSSTTGGGHGGGDDATSSVDTSSTSAASTCGDGHVDPGEECDGGGLEDGACSATCVRERVVFVSSALYQADDLGSLQLADGICRQLAEEASLPNFATFSAWLSDSTTSARDRVFPSPAQLVRTDGVVVAASFDALLAGLLLAPIVVDEHGLEVPDPGTWTGTRPDGSAVPGGTFCDDWSSGMVADFSGYRGDASAVDGNWTLLDDPDINPTTCIHAHHVYCLEGQ